MVDPERPPNAVTGRPLALPKSLVGHAGAAGAVVVLVGERVVSNKEYAHEYEGLGHINPGGPTSVMLP
jgi:hypothetical protein